MMNVSLPCCKGNTFFGHEFRCAKIFWLGGMGIIHGLFPLRRKFSFFIFVVECKYVLSPPCYESASDKGGANGTLFFQTHQFFICLFTDS